MGGVLLVRSGFCDSVLHGIHSNDQSQHASEASISKQRRFERIKGSTQKLEPYQRLLLQEILYRSQHWGYDAKAFSRQWLVSQSYIIG